MTTIETALAGLKTDTTAIAAELAAEVPPVGSTVSQAQVDRLTDLASRVTAVKNSLDALVVPATPPVTPVFDPNDPTPNGSVMADGVTIRNTPGADPANPMAGFDPSKPITS